MLKETHCIERGIDMGLVDPVYGVNNFNRAKVLSETETYANNILMILFGKPGFYPSIPSLGMDINQYLYMFEDEIDVNAIKTKLASQCRELLIKFEDETLDVYTTTYNERSMLVFHLPTIIDNNTSGLILGVTLNEKGEMVYNFVNSSDTQTI